MGQLNEHRSASVLYNVSLRGPRHQKRLSVDSTGGCTSTCLTALNAWNGDINCIVQARRRFNRFSCFCFQYYCSGLRRFYNVSLRGPRHQKRLSVDSTGGCTSTCLTALKKRNCIVQARRRFNRFSCFCFQYYCSGLRRFLSAVRPFQAVPICKIIQTT
jgi:hypothetical protein